MSDTPSTTAGDFATREATAMIPARDVARARKWYEEKLGIPPSETPEYGVGFALNGVRAFLYETGFAGTAEHTLLTFSSDDLVADMAAMREQGVEFIEYDLPGIKTENGLATFGPVKNAWCRDSEGNILGFVEGM